MGLAVAGIPVVLSIGGISAGYQPIAGILIFGPAHAVALGAVVGYDVTPTRRT